MRRNTLTMKRAAHMLITLMCVVNLALTITQKEKEHHTLQGCIKKLEESITTLVGTNERIVRHVKRVQFSQELFSELYDVNYPCAIILREDQLAKFELKDENKTIQELIKIIQKSQNNPDAFLTLDEKSEFVIQLNKLAGKMLDRERLLANEIKKEKRESLSPLRANLNRLSPTMPRSPLTGGRNRK